LARDSDGDLVVWAQEHLKGGGQTVRINGIYNRRTVRAVKRFQRARGLTVDGRIAAKTWRALLAEDPQMVDWSTRRARSKAGGSGAEPRSASLPSSHDEIPPPPRR
jgi:peptidoglycan hydrolase-like protein with peptidoglycan-binding domain